MQGAASISLGVIMAFKLNALNELHAKAAVVTTVRCHRQVQTDD
jgi:hypothetical protein